MSTLCVLLYRTPSIKRRPSSPYLFTTSIYKFSLSLGLFASNKLQNAWTDQAQILCGTSRGPRDGLWMIKICLRQNSIFIKFLKIFKILDIFY